MITEMIGSARVPLRFFCVPLGLTEWIELFFMGMPAGRIQFRSEYFPEVVVGNGIGNTTVIVEPAPMIMGGGMGGGGGGGMMKGALMGAMVATDIALMERNAHHNNHHNTRVVVVNTHGHRR